MAGKHPYRRRRRFNLRKVRISGSTPVGALATLDLTTGAFCPVAAESYRVMSIDITWGLVDLGATQDDGQEFGVAHSDYSAAEVEACLESTTSVDQGDKTAQELAGRLVRTIGSFQGAAGTGAGLSFNNGRPKKTKLNWLIGSGDGINTWIRNGSGNVYTTGAQLSRLGNMWIKQPA